VCVCVCVRAAAAKWRRTRDKHVQTGAGSSLQITLSALTDLGSGGGTASHVCRPIIIHL
jgi:hypothetical protein